MAPRPAAHILIVARRDPQAPLRRALREAGYRVTSAESVPQAVRAVDRSGPALIVADPRVLAPDTSEAIAECASTHEIPLVTQWADTKALLCTIEELLDPLGLPEEPSHELKAGPLRIDFAAHVAEIDEKDLNLTAREFELLCHFARHPGWAWSRQELLEQVWGYDYGDPRVVTVHIANLRQKLAAVYPAADLIQTVRGVGYRFSAATPSDSPPVREGEELLADEGSATPDARIQDKNDSECSGESPRITDERRLVTVMFLHVSGLQVLERTEGFESLRLLLDSLFESVIPCIERYGGMAERFIGRSVIAVFGAPPAQDNDAEMAVRAALDMRSTVEDFRADHGLDDISIHIGVSTGTVVAGTTEDGSAGGRAFVGDTVDVAALIADMAGPGEILISEQCRQMVGSRFVAELVGTVRPRGESEESSYYMVEGFTGCDRPGISVAADTRQLIGRGREMLELCQALDDLGGDTGNVVFIVGEAGIGKTRLAGEACREATQRGAKWLLGRAVSFGETMGYLPFIEIIEADCGIEVGDGQKVRKRKLKARLKELFADSARDLVPTFSALIGVPTQQRTESLVDEDDRTDDERRAGRVVDEAIAKYLVRISMEQPVLIVLDDVHWLDRSSVRLVKNLLSVTEVAPVTLCLVGRGEPGTTTLELLRAAQESREVSLREIRVAPLSDSEAGDFIRDLLAAGETHSEFVRDVQRVAEGNPLFIGEIIRHLVDLGVVQLDHSGRWRVQASASEVPIPGTIQGIIAARIDQLPEPARQILHCASVIGRSFGLRLLEAVLDEDGTQAAGYLDCLVDRGLLLLRRQEPEKEYVFKHALVQEVAYGTMLTRRSRELHRKVARAISEMSPDQKESTAATIGYHYVRGEEWDRAEPYLVRAGELSAELSADPEALAHYQAAMSTLLLAYEESWSSEHSEERAEWLVERMEGLWHVQCMGELAAPLRLFYNRVVNTHGLADPRSQAACFLLASCCRNTGQYAEATEMLEGAIAAADSNAIEKDRLTARLLMLLGLCRLTADRFTEAETMFAEALQIEADNDATEGPLAQDLADCLAESRLLTGDMAAVRRVGTEARERSEGQQGDRQRMTLVYACESDLILGDWEEAARLAEDCLARAQSPFIRVYVRLLLGRIRHAQGSYLEAEEHLRRAVAEYEQLGRPVLVGEALASLAEAQLQSGRLDKADASIKRAISLLEDCLSGDSSKLAYPCWTLAGVRIAQKAFDEATNLLEKSEEIFESKWKTTHPFGAEIAFRRALLHRFQEGPSGAQSEFEGAIGLLVEAAGPDHPRIDQMSAEWKRMAQANAGWPA